MSNDRLVRLSAKNFHKILQAESPKRGRALSILLTMSNQTALLLVSLFPILNLDPSARRNNVAKSSSVRSSGGNVV